jgi:hypothetical protein
MYSSDAAAAYNSVANGMSIFFFPCKKPCPANRYANHRVCFVAGPVAQNVKDQSAKTTAELSKLAASRQTPSYPAATGQPLTHYHSFFSELLSWNNPREFPHLSSAINSC